MPSPQPLIDQYQNYLIRACMQDVTAFARWFEGTSRGAFNPQAVDPRDVQDYRGYLVRRDLALATVNRRLKALKGLSRWVRREKLATEDPFDVLESVILKEQKNTAVPANWR